MLSCGQLPQLGQIHVDAKKKTSQLHLFHVYFFFYNVKPWWVKGLASKLHLFHIYICLLMMSSLV